MILRTIYPDGSEFYRDLQGFHLIPRESHLFDGIGAVKYGEDWQNKPYPKNVRAFVATNYGRDVYPIFEGQNNYVLNDMGSVFLDLSGDLPAKAG